MSSRNALLRMARREVLRAKGRSALIILMILAPIAIMTLIDVTARSALLSDEETVRRATGAADTRVNWSGISSIEQNVVGEWRPAGNNVATPSNDSLGEPDVRSQFPGSTVISEDRTSVRARSKDGIAFVEFRMIDYSNPVVAGLYEQKSGRAPQSTNEIALTKSAAERLGATVGKRVDILTAGGKLNPLVVGIVESPSSLRSDIAVGMPGFIERTSETYFQTFHFIDTSTPITWQRVQELNKLGFVVYDNALVANPPKGSEFSTYDGGIGRDETAILVLLGGLATMEICLLAGAAFAVGIRRQRRSLALLAATGGTSRQMRDVVLSMAVVLGLIASVLGVAVGVVFVLIGKPWLEHLHGARFGHFEVLPRDITIIVLTGLAAALLSAIVPARTAARMDVTAALNGRRDAHASRRRWKLPVAGGALIALGMLVAAAGATTNDLSIVLIGAVVGEIGVVMMTSLLVGLVGRFARWLPLGPRLALRDAVRNRTRTAPVVAAIMAAVAGAFAMSMFVSTYEVNDREQYTSEYPKGFVSVGLDPESPDNAKQLTEVRSILTTTLPVDHVGSISTACVTSATSSCYSSLVLERVGDNKCPADDALANGNADVARKYVNDPRCAKAGSFYSRSESVVVADAGFVRALFGSNGDQAAKALDDGLALATNHYDVSDGRVNMNIWTYRDGAEPESRMLQLPATSFPVAERTSPPSLIMSKSTAEAHGLVASSPFRMVASTDRMPTGAEEDRARDALTSGDVVTDVHVEKGFKSAYGIGLLVLSIATAVLALMATGIAAGLALADGRADQGTLAAIGAGPGIRRISSAFQAFVIAVLGVGLGLLAGAVPGAGIAWVARYREFAPGVQVHLDVPWMDVVPWSTVGVLLVAVPLVAAVFAWLFTRSRIPLGRRAT
jgi:putative ABC transport system permease protein